MRKILFAAILLASPLAALGAPRIDYVVSLPDYNLSQFGGLASGSVLNGSVISGKETPPLDRFSEKIKYNAGGRKIAYLGARIFIYAREQEGKIYFLVRVELCERDKVTDEITRSTTNFQGHRDSGEPFYFDAKAPGNKQTRIEITLTTRQ